MDGRVQLAASSPPSGSLTRRRLLGLGGAGLLAMGAAGEAIATLSRRAPSGSAGAKAPGPSLRGLRRSDYAPHIGRAFTLTPAGGPAVPARLVAVEDFPGAWARRLAGSEDAFILLFHAPPSAPRPGQAIMRVSGPWGSFGDLLLSPAGPGRHGLDYAAVINRAIPPGVKI